MDKKLIEEGVRLILKGIGEDLDREGLKDTPRRVADMYEEIFSGINQDPSSVIKSMFDENHDEIIVIKDIPFYSVCEHHLIPFIGKAHVAYIPNLKGEIAGLSKITRLFDLVAKRPQVQERLTTIVADTLEMKLEARAVLVIVEAEHLCMSMRGVKKPKTVTITSAVRGVFRRNPASRAEAFALIKDNR
ncbi:MAG: GTP cyclohydrolase I FolE [Actinobacteria bacterium]|nr:GTP cyclohydrolase I FolE [Actinomycetota bacterium]